MNKYQAIAYVQRKRITDWKRLVLTHHSPDFVYGSNDDRVFKSLSSGDILWIVSSVPGRSPELVARLEVAKVREKWSADLGVSKELLRHFCEFKWIAKGTSKSRFYGHNDAGPALMNSVFENSSGEPWSFSDDNGSWNSKYGSRLQRPTKLHTPGNVESKYGGRQLPLEELAARSKHSVFISWKWNDHNREIPLRLAHALAEHGYMVWLDHLALPDSRALRKVQKDMDKLERLLRYGYQQSSHLMVIESENYGEKTPTSDRNWTFEELKGDLAQRTKLKMFCFRPQGSEKSQHISPKVKRLKAREPEKAAQEFSRPAFASKA